MTEIDYVKFGQLLRKHRKAMNLSQQALSELLGTTPQHISNVELAKKRPGIDLIAKIAVFFNLDLNALFGFETSATKIALTTAFSRLLEDASIDELKMCYALCETYLKKIRSE